MILFQLPRVKIEGGDACAFQEGSIYNRKKASSMDQKQNVILISCKEAWSQKYVCGIRKYYYTHCLKDIQGVVDGLNISVGQVYFVIHPLFRGVATSLGGTVGPSSCKAVGTSYLWCPLYFFPFSSFLLDFCICFCIFPTSLFTCSNVHEFHIFYNRTE